METKRLAQFIGVHPDSVRRWTRRYGQFMSNSATPRTGDTRIYTRHDAAIMLYIATQRETGFDLDQIFDRLKALQANQWRDLDPAPEEWFEPLTETSISLVEASSRAAELAQVAVLQSELQYTRDELQQSLQRVEKLERDIEQLQSSERASQTEITSLRLDLEAERGKVNTLSAQLQQYALGGKTPVPVGAILIRAAIAGAALVAAALVLARVLL